MSCGENGCEVGRERQSRLAGTDAERDWDWMWCDGITHHPRRGAEQVGNGRQIIAAVAATQQ